MKKTFLFIGTLTTVLIPISTMIACDGGSGQDGQDGQDGSNIKTSLRDESNKLQNFSTTDAANKTSSDFTTLTTRTNAKALYDGLANKDDLFTSGLICAAIKSVAVKTVYDSTTKTIILTFTLEKGDEQIKKDITITFVNNIDLQSEVDKLIDFYSADIANRTDNDVTTLKVSSTDVKNLFDKIASRRAMFSSTLSRGVVIESVVVQTIYNVGSKEIIFKITLGKNDAVVINNTKNVKVTFRH